MVERAQAIIRYHFGLIVTLGLAAVLKAVVLTLEAVPFNADEAVVALMARHILQGERPVFFYGQAYLGSTDAWLVAGAFLIFGQGVIAIRLMQVALYLGTIFTTYRLGLKIYQDRWVATVAALLLAIPVVLITLYTTATLGGYGETLLIGNGLLLWALRLREESGAGAARSYEWLLFGGLAGFGFWTFGLLGVYLLPIGLLLMWESMNRAARPTNDDKSFQNTPSDLRALPVKMVFALLGFTVGSSPWWWATLFGAATVSELGGSAIEGASQTEWFATVGLRLFSLLVLGTTVISGLRPPWAVQWLALPLAPIAILMFFASLGWAVKTGRTHPPTRLLLGLCATLATAFLITPFGNDPSGRYFLPLAPPLALFAADLLRRVRTAYPRAAPALLVAVLAFNLWGNLEPALTFPPGITTQFDKVAQVNQRDLPAVIEFLRVRSETRGYTNYWVSFPLAFLSNEELIFTAALPYHEDFRYTPRDNRYTPYQEIVAVSDRVAYLTTNHPALNNYLRAQFQQMGIRFEEKAIGDFQIFYSLSRPVTPEELGIYEQAPMTLQQRLLGKFLWPLGEDSAVMTGGQ